MMTTTPSEDEGGVIPYKEPLLSDLMADMQQFFEQELPEQLEERGIDPSAVHVSFSDIDTTEPNF